MTEEKEKAIESALPPDAEFIKSVGSVEFYFSKQHHKLYIEMAECHTGPVAFEREEILKLLDLYDQHAHQKEQNLIADLDLDDEDFK